MFKIKKSIISKKALAVGNLALVMVVFIVFHQLKIQTENNYVVVRQPVFENPFKDIILEAKSAYVFDLIRQEPLFELNSHTQLPLASITKIMMAIVAEEKLPETELEALSDIFKAALVSSSNNAAQAIATRTEDFMNNESFLEAMNIKAKELKLNQTYFLNETGLDVSDIVGGAYGSAVDIVSLISYAAKTSPSLFEITTKEEIGDFKNTNITVGSTTQIILSKTGFTDLANGNLAVIFDAGFGHPVAVVVLSSSKEGRFTDVDKLINATFKYLIKQ